jgi:hypothetical protein
MINRDPSEDVEEYAAAVLKLYLHLPETPLKPSSIDRQTAVSLYARGVSLINIESALLLASARRLSRSPDLPRLTPIRSLAYFLPVIEEILCNPVPNHYLHYLRKKVASLSCRENTASCG